MESICKDCGKRIYWVDDLSEWYHWNGADILTCPGAGQEVVPADYAEV